MTFELFRLEWRRNRLSAAAMAAAFLLTLPVSGLVASTTGMEAGRALEALLIAWDLLGLPLSAALIGAAAGAAAGGRDAVEAEAPLPLSPGRRAAASASASLLLAAALITLIVGVSTALGVGPARAYMPGQKAWGQSVWYSLELGPVMLLLTVDLLLGAWALSRLIGHGVAGGLLAVVLSGLGAVALLGRLGLAAMHRDWGVPGAGAVWLALAAGAAAKALAGARAAAWAERRSGGAELARVVALLVVPTLAAYALTSASAAALSRRLALHEPPAVYYYHSPRGDYQRGDFPRGAAALKAAGEGVLAQSVRGGVYLVGAAGAAEAIGDRVKGSFDLLLSPGSTWVHGVYRDREGRAWIDRYDSPNHQLWRVTGARAEQARTPPGEYGSLTMLDGIPVKRRYADGPEALVAAAADYFEKGHDAAWSRGDSAFLRERAAELDLARIACDGRCLRAGGRTWRLPGQTLAEGAVEPDEAGGRRVYLVPVRTARGHEVALCREDGTVEIAWPLRLTRPGAWWNSYYEGLPDGTLFAFGPRRTLGAIGPDGRVRPPLSYAALERRLGEAVRGVPGLVRLADGKAWLVWGGRLSVVDASGEVAWSRPLPSGIAKVRPLEGGFVIETRDGLFVSDFDGKTRPARR